MIKYLFLLLTLTSLTSFAWIDKNTCPPTDPNFRECFQDEVYQSCMQHGGNSFICSRMHLIYYLMKVRFHGTVNACRQNNRTEKDVIYCLEDWSCYLHGKYYKSDQPCVEN